MILQGFSSFNDSVVQWLYGAGSESREVALTPMVASALCGSGTGEHLIHPS